MSMITVGILGVGTMGEALIKGIQASAFSEQVKISGSTRSRESAESVAKAYGVSYEELMQRAGYLPGDPDCSANSEAELLPEPRVYFRNYFSRYRQSYCYRTSVY